MTSIGESRQRSSVNLYRICLVPNSWLRIVIFALLCAARLGSMLCSWEVHSRRCVERFSNNDGTITSALDATSQFLAVGAESGVVNLYSEREPLGIAKSPLKSVMNLHTSADAIRFNSDGQILAMSTRREQQGLKLLHVPSKTVFSNWPTSKTPLGYVWSMDFSPESRFLAIGNDKGKCLLYRINHYQDE